MAVIVIAVADSHRGFDVQDDTLHSFRRLHIEESSHVLCGLCMPLMMPVRRPMATWQGQWTDWGILGLRKLYFCYGLHSVCPGCCNCYDVPIKGRPGSCSIWQSAIYCVTNCNFSSVQWLQASLPVRDGGLGIRSYHRMPVFAGIPDGLVGAIWHISSSSPFWTNFLGPAYCCSGLC